MTTIARKAHPEDLLIAGSRQEAGMYRQFPASQVVTSNANWARIQGRRPRRIWVAPGARKAMTDDQRDDLRLIAHASGTWPTWVEQWEEEPLTLVERIAELPAQNPTKSRDFGRGYAQAVRDVLALIEDFASGD